MEPARVRRERSRRSFRSPSRADSLRGRRAGPTLMGTLKENSGGGDRQRRHEIPVAHHGRAGARDDAGDRREPQGDQVGRANDPVRFRVRRAKPADYRCSSIPKPLHRQSENRVVINKDTLSDSAMVRINTEILARIAAIPGVRGATQFIGCGGCEERHRDDRLDGLWRGKAGYVPTSCLSGSAGMIATIGVPMAAWPRLRRRRRRQVGKRSFSTSERPACSTRTRRIRVAGRSSSATLRRPKPLAADRRRDSRSRPRLLQVPRGGT